MKLRKFSFMKRRLVILTFAFVAALAITSPMQASWAKHYTVYYNCIISPPPGVVGEWDVDCEGNWSGWGWKPGHSCTRYEVEFVEWCPEYASVSPRIGSPADYRNARAINQFAATRCSRRPPADI